MDPRQVPRIMGKLGNERGRDNELRVLAACMLPNRPAWIRTARLATKAEDHDGIDLVEALPPSEEVAPEQEGLRLTPRLDDQRARPDQPLPTARPGVVRVG